MKKKGVSPVIATILLIALVVIIAIIVFTWFRGLTGESLTKFGGQNIQIVCEDVEFDASYSGNQIYFSNLGNIPIYDVDLKIEEPGNFYTSSASEIDGWIGLKQGGRFSGPITFLPNTNKITLIPILRGINEDGIEKNQACEERHSETIIIL